MFRVRVRLWLRGDLGFRFMFMVVVEIMHKVRVRVGVKLDHYCWEHVQGLITVKVKA